MRVFLAVWTVSHHHRVSFDIDYRIACAANAPPLSLQPKDLDTKRLIRIDIIALSGRIPEIDVHERLPPTVLPDLSIK